MRSFFKKIGATLKYILIGSVLTGMLIAADNTIFSFIIMSNLTGFDVLIGGVLPFILHIWIIIRCFRAIKRTWGLHL